MRIDEPQSPLERTALLLGRQPLQFEMRVVSNPRATDFTDPDAREILILHKGAVVLRRRIDARDVLLLNEILLEPRLLGLTLQAQEGDDASGLVFTVLDRDHAEAAHLRTEDALQGHLAPSLQALGLDPSEKVAFVLGTVKIAKRDRVFPNSRAHEAVALYRRILDGSVLHDIESLLNSIP